MDRALDGDGPLLRLEEDPSITYGPGKTGVAGYDLGVKKGEALEIRPELRDGDIGISVEGYWNGTLVGVVGDELLSFNSEFAVEVGVPCFDGGVTCPRHGDCESGDQGSTNVEQQMKPAWLVGLVKLRTFQVKFPGACVSVSKDRTFCRVLTHFEEIQVGIRTMYGFMPLIYSTSTSESV